MYTGWPFPFHSINQCVNTCVRLITYWFLITWLQLAAPASVSKPLRLPRACPSPAPLHFLTPVVVTVSTFEEAVEAIKENKAISQDEQLALYGLYKQANIGDVNIERPGMLNMSGKAKWDAWKKEEGKTNDEAKAAYVTLVGELNAKYA